MSLWTRVGVVVAIGALWIPHHGSAQGLTVHASAQAIAAWFHAGATPAGRPLSEARVVQPMLRTEARWGAHLLGLATLDLEGLTMPRGELAPGAWGEGFVDRRHPHTYAHELVVEATAGWHCRLAGRCRVGGFAGKGFAPFGSDDPMSRPILRYPVNHHLAQIPERAVVAFQLEAGHLTLEGGVFNGDEPERPAQWPRLGRFGDSWSARSTVRPLPGIEVSGSIARVASPEHRPGAGAAQDKTHLGIRLEREVEGNALYALAEWARTSELDGFFRFHSALVEAAWRRARLRLSYRFERTERPEEERIEPFRSVRPHLENSIVGITRWTLHTASLTATLGPFPGGLRVEPMAEVTHGAVANAAAGAFDPVATYGRDRSWSGVLGIRVAWRHQAHRMGRYGVLGDRATGGHGEGPHGAR